MIHNGIRFAMDIQGGSVVGSAASQQEDHGFKGQQSQVKRLRANSNPAPPH